MLGLPDDIEACLFDMDGVLTDTASVHAAAWKQMFDAFLRARGEREFDIRSDYDEYVDGRTREEGVRAFLRSRDIDPSDAEVDALAARKNDILLARMRSDGVRAFDGSVRYLDAVLDAGLHAAVVSSSANTREALRAAGIDDRFEVYVDGNVIAREHLASKPAPDSFVHAARELGLGPESCAVFEDALAGVQAGRDGGFGCVVGVDRKHEAAELREHGADVVVSDLADLLR